MRHEINTVEDILRVVTPENKEAFIKDFSLWLDTYFAVKGLVEVAGGKAEHAQFVWIDDGKHNIKVTLSPAPPPSQ